MYNEVKRHLHFFLIRKKIKKKKELKQKYKKNI